MTTKDELRGVKFFILFIGICVILGGCDVGYPPTSPVTYLPNNSVSLAAYMKVLPGSEGIFVPQFLDVLDQTRAEEGCISFDLYKSFSDSSVFLFQDNWKDMEAIEYHWTTPYFQAAMELSSVLLNSFDVTMRITPLTYPITYDINRTIVFYRMNTTIGMEESARQALLMLVDSALKQPGCISSDLYQGFEVFTSPSVFIIHENWDSQATFEAYRASEEYNEFYVQLEILFDEPIEVHICSMVSQPE